MEHDNIANKALQEQWKKLILGPLLEVKDTSIPSPLLLIIDALDEYDNDDDIRLVLKLLSSLEVQAIKSTKLRIFITSRQDTPIRLGFRDMPAILHRDLVLDDVARPVVDGDLRAYFNSEFGLIRKRNSDYSKQLDTWPGDDIISLLVSRSEGLFIYAATLCRFLQCDDDTQEPIERLSELLDDKSTREIDAHGNAQAHPLELDKMYTQILNHQLKRVTLAREQRKLKSVIGPLATLFEPLSTGALGALLSLEEKKVSARLRGLRSVFNLPEDKTHAVRFLHTSFRDFLCDEKRCPAAFFVEARKEHGSIARMCLKLMSKLLKKNICGVQELGDVSKEDKFKLVSQHIPFELQYACRYWVQHLCKCNDIHHLASEDGIVEVFLREHLLHWLEALSWMDKAAEGVTAIISLEDAVKVSLHIFYILCKRF